MKQVISLSTLCCGLVVSPGLLAADFFFVPDVYARAEYHSNLDLRGDEANVVNPQEKSVEGYIAGLGGVFGVRGLRGSTELRPLIEFQEYPDRDDMEESNQYLDLNSEYQTLRSKFLLAASYSRESEYNSEITDAGFDDFDPDDPVVDGTGRIVFLNQVRTRIQARPEYTYQFSQRVGAGVNGLYQTVNFDADAQLERVDYDYWQGNGFLQWIVSPRSTLRTGVYVGKYEADNGSNTTDSEGISLDLEHRWTETFIGTASLQAERTDIDLIGTTRDEEEDNWGLTVGVRQRGQISNWRFTAGRSFSPSGGSRATIDQVRLQYDRNLTQRLELISAVRGFQRKAQGSSVGGNLNDRDYVRGEIGLRWNMTQTWYVGTGYAYTWQKYESDPGSEEDHMVMVQMGYKGLPPQR